MKTQIRDFTLDDLDSCAEIAAGVWPVINRLGGNGKALMSAYIGMSMLDSDYRKVCCINGRLAGLLFGRTGGRKKDSETLLIKRKIWSDFIKGRCGSRARILKFIFLLMITELKVKQACRKYKSELVLFFVDGSVQGKGIGSGLLNDYMEYAGSRNIKSIYLYTDVECNWRFYEKRGFEKLKNFYDNGLSFLAGKKMESFIYVYNLTEKE